MSDGKLGVDRGDDNIGDDVRARRSDRETLL